MSACREFDFSEREFFLLRELVSRHTGISLSAEKQNLVYSRLSRRLRALQLDSFEKYCSLINAGNENELEQFTNAITTNLTSFFREPHHFEHLKQELIPKLHTDNAQSRRLRIWSAGCSTGEEPYSIAITLREAIAEINNWDIKILATDLDSSVITRASRGIYNMDTVAGLSKESLKDCFRKGTGSQQGLVKITADIRKLIHFHKLNLMQEWPMHGPFDIIFCRNVVIYFDKPTQSTLFNRFADIMATGGHLFVGHSESLRAVTERFELIGKTVYRKAGR